MYRLLSFLRRIYVLLIFLVLEGFALYFYASSTTHSRARMLGASDRILSGLYGGIAGAENFMSLGATNRLLAGRVASLENELASYRTRLAAEALDSTRLAVLDSMPSRTEFPLQYQIARVVRNRISGRENYITLDRGTRDGVERGMAAVSLDGYMVGYVESCSERNSICVSVLNTTFRASGRVVGSDHFGSISWRGGDLRKVTLSEVPKYAEVALGDTVVTSGYSFYFPEGIGIGTIEDFTVDETRASYDIDVRLGVDISALRVVMLVKNPEVYERIELEEQTLGGDENQ